MVHDDSLLARDTVWLSCGYERMIGLWYLPRLFRCLQVYGWKIVALVTYSTAPLVVLGVATGEQRGFWVLPVQ